MEFRVKWEIDIESENPYEAARDAFLIMQRKGTEAVFFECVDENGKITEIDLMEYGHIYDRRYELE